MYLRISMFWKKHINKCFNINVFLFVTSNIYLSVDLVQNTKHNIYKVTQSCSNVKLTSYNLDAKLRRCENTFGRTFNSVQSMLLGTHYTYRYVFLWKFSGLPNDADWS